MKDEQQVPETTGWGDRTVTVTYSQIVTALVTWVVLDFIKLTLDHLL